MLDGAIEPEQQGPIGGDLGYLKFAIFKGDNGTFSITLAVNNEDDELRATLTRPEAFDETSTMLDPVAPWVADGVSEPITGVHPMARLVNRIRHFVVDGEPLVTGFAALGDASVCTNPLYGRGCSLAMVHAELLADALDVHPDPGSRDLVARVRRGHGSRARALVPRLGPSRRAEPEARGTRRRAGPRRPAHLRAVDPARRCHAGDSDRSGRVPRLRARVQPVGRAQLAVSDPDLLARVLSVYQERDQREPDPPLGPPRQLLLDRLASRASAA